MGLPFFDASSSQRFVYSNFELNIPFYMAFSL